MYLPNEEDTLEALLLRPRPLRNIPPHPSITISAWIGGLDTQDQRKLVQYFGIPDGSDLVSSIYSVGLLEWWHCVATHDQPAVVTAVETILARIVTPVSVWTAGMIQLLVDLPSVSKRSCSNQADQRISSQSIKFEGLAQFLFPSESTRLFVDSFVSPYVDELGAVTQRRSLPVPVMMRCCMDVAPYFATHSWSGMDVPKCAKYYPLAAQLCERWAKYVNTIRSDRRTTLQRKTAHSDSDAEQ
jgi:hypothetical protein